MTDMEEGEEGNYHHYCKTVPDLLSCNKTAKKKGDEGTHISSSIEPFTIYQYTIRVEFDRERSSQRIIRDCPSCSNLVQAFKHFGIGFLQPIPQEIIREMILGMLRESDVIHLKILDQGTRKFDLTTKPYHRELWANMQRYHRAVIAWESDLLSKYPASIQEQWQDDFWIDPTQPLPALPTSNNSCQVSIDHTTWAMSSNGLWYIIFPYDADGVITYPRQHQQQQTTPSRYNATSETSSKGNYQSQYGQHLPPQQQQPNFERMSTIFYNPKRWSSYVKEAADKAQILVDNMLLQRKLNYQVKRSGYKPEGNTLPWTEENPIFTLPPKELETMIVSHGNGNLFKVVAGLPLSSGSTESEDDEQDDDERPQGDSMHGAKQATRRSSSMTAIKRLKHICRFDSIKILTVQAHIQQGLLHQIVQSNDRQYEETRQIENGGKNRLHKGKKQTEEEDPHDYRFTPVTYYQAFVEKYPALKPFLVKKHPKEQEAILQAKLLAVVPTIARLSSVPLLFSNNAGNKGKKAIAGGSKKPHQHNKTNAVLPHIYRPLGASKYFYPGLVIPDLVGKLSNLLIAQECREYIVEKIITPQLKTPAKGIASSSATTSSSSLNKQAGNMHPLQEKQQVHHTSSLSYPYPSISTILQALTPCSMHDLSGDYECLEILGDAILKLLISYEVYVKFRKQDERYLTETRRDYINNEYLAHVCHCKHLIPYIRRIAVANGKQEVLLRSPGMQYELTSAYNNGSGERSLWNKTVFAGCDNGGSINTKQYNKTSASAGETIDHAVEEVEDNDEGSNLPLYLKQQAEYRVEQQRLYQLQTMYPMLNIYYTQLYPKPGYQAVPELALQSSSSSSSSADTATSSTNTKIFADVIEALLGAFYLSSYQESAYRSLTIPKALLQGLGITVRNTTNGYREKAQPLQGNDLPYEHIMALTGSILQGYRFNDWSLLTMAFTHPSYLLNNHRLYSYQRLEFLGDAVLDMMVVSLLYRRSLPTVAADAGGSGSSTMMSTSSPGEITTRKMWCVNNISLGHIGAYWKLFKYLRYDPNQNPVLFREFSQLEKWLMTPHGGKYDTERPAGQAANGSQGSHKKPVAVAIGKTANSNPRKRKNSSNDNSTMKEESKKVEVTLEIEHPSLPSSTSSSTEHEKCAHNKLIIVTTMVATTNNNKRQKKNDEDDNESTRTAAAVQKGGGSGILTLSGNMDITSAYHRIGKKKPVVDEERGDGGKEAVKSHYAENNNARMIDCERKEIEIYPTSSKVMADMVEALLGALYLDCKGDMFVIEKVVENLQVLPKN